MVGVQGVREQMVIMQWSLAANGDHARLCQDVHVLRADGLGDPEALRRCATELSSASTLVMLITCS